MIKARDAIATGRQLLGTPYTTYDCINFIKKIIRTAPGGQSNYQTAGTNTLWRSRDLTYKQISIDGARAGMLVFKRRDDPSRDDGVNVYHIGLVTDACTVLHSSSARGEVVETDLDSSWHYLAIHKLIDPAEDTAAAADALFTAAVNTASGSLNLRAQPSTSAAILQRMPKGAMVDVLDTTQDEWWRIRYKGIEGYAASVYLAANPVNREQDDDHLDQDPGDDAAQPEEVTTLINDWGMSFTLLGRWRIAED